MELVRWCQDMKKISLNRIDKTLLQKSKWVFLDKSEAEGLIQELTYHITQLEELFPGNKSTHMQLAGEEQAVIRTSPDVLSVLKQLVEDKSNRDEFLTKLVKASQTSSQTSQSTSVGGDVVGRDQFGKNNKGIQSAGGVTKSNVSISNN